MMEGLYTWCFGSFGTVVEPEARSMGVWVLVEGVGRHGLWHEIIDGDTGHFI